MAQRGAIPPRSRRIYLKGVGTVSTTARGAFVFRTTTLTRKKTPTQAQLYAQATMAIAARMVSMATPFEIESAKEIAGQGGYTWKDVLISSFYGTMLEFTDSTGQLWQSRRILAANIQQMLDSISPTTGAVLVRTANGWAALLPGAEQYVMTMKNNGTDLLPDWAPPGASGATALSQRYGALNINPQNDQTIGVGTFVGVPIFLPAGYKIGSIGTFISTAAATATLTPAVYKWSSGANANKVGDGPAVTTPAVGYKSMLLSTPYTCDQNTVYIVGALNLVATAHVAQSWVQNNYKTGLSSLPSTLSSYGEGSNSGNTCFWTEPA